MKAMLIFFLAAVHSVFAEQTIVAVGEAEIEKPAIVFAQTDGIKDLSVGTLALAKSFLGVLKSDLGFYKHLFELSESSDAESRKYFAHQKRKLWKKKNYDFVIASRASNSGQKLTLAFKLYIIEQEDREGTTWEKSISVVDPLSRKQAHRVADQLVREMTGKPSFFLSEIVFISDRGKLGKDAPKELHIADFDGFNVKQLTSWGGTAISPALSPDGKKIVYSLIKKRKGKRNINLYIYDRNTKKNRLVSSRDGINSGAIFSADGQSLYLTLSHKGNAEIYQIDLQGKILQRITQHYADDVDPSVNAAGDLMAFLSSRSGKAMIHKLDPRGTEKAVDRIGYVGKFNATPRFSPDGKEIVFSSWKDNAFDIFRLSTDKNQLVRLTKDLGSNEDPSFSNDGEFILFSSQKILTSKRARQDLIIMNRDGEILGNITEDQDLGNCTSPRFSW